MLIFTQDEKTIINLDCTGSLFIDATNPADVPVFAKTISDEKIKKIGRYESIEQAHTVLFQIVSAVDDNRTVYYAPLSCICAPEKTKKDARTRRKGGS